jgi:N-acetylmuramoyl-L-alanine amidase
VLRRTALFLSLAVFLSSVLLVSQQQPLTVISSTARRPLPTTTVGEQEYVGIDDLAMMFQLTVREDPPGMLNVGYKNKTILLTQDQPLGSVGGRVIQLPAPTIRANRRWLVPVDFIGRALALVYDSKITLRRPSRLVIVGDLRVPRVQVRYDTSTGSGQGASGVTARVTVDATPKAASTISQDGDQLLMKFDADAIDLANAVAPFAGAAQGLITGVRLADPVTLAFTIGPRFGGFKVTTQTSDTSTRQTIDVASAGQGSAAPSEPPDVARGESKGPAPDLSGLISSGSAVLRTITIDPGHGGDDEGAKGPGGTREKDVTLAVARKLKAALEARLGVRVLLTRDDDHAVAIDDRTAVANNGKADLFISLHANASWRPSLAGATISTAHFDHQAEQAARALPSELVPALGGAPRDIEFIPWDVAQIPHLDQSNMLARTLEEQLRGHVPLAGKPLASAPLRVLEPANMAAVLIEIGYLTNAEQEKQLAADNFQNTFVQALVEGIVRYRDSFGGGR